MATSPKVLTADDLLDLPDPEGGNGWELVDGQLVPVMCGSLIHGRIIAELSHRLLNHIREHGLAGEIFVDSGSVLGLRRDPERMRRPDVMYVQRGRLAGHDPERIFRDVPDLAIEIDLTSGRKSGGHERILDYLEAGVRLVWAIDIHTGTAMAYRRDGSARLVRADEALDGEDVVPGFRLPLAELFD